MVAAAFAALGPVARAVAAHRRRSRSSARRAVVLRRAGAPRALARALRGPGVERRARWPCFALDAARRAARRAALAGVRFLCFLLVNKLWNRRASRDYLQAYVVSFLMLVAGAALY